MSDLTNLPADITPKDFFALVAETVASEAAPDNPRPERGQITLQGEGGGAWNFGFRDGNLTIEAGEASGAPVHLALSVEDWRAFVAGTVRDALQEHVESAVIDPAALTKLYESAEKVDQVMALKGTLRVTIEDEGRDYLATIATGGADPAEEPATASINMTLADFGLIASGAENPQMAFFSGKIRVDGDMNHVMGLFALTM